MKVCTSIHTYVHTHVRTYICRLADNCFAILIMEQNRMTLFMKVGRPVLVMGATVVSVKQQGVDSICCGCLLEALTKCQL